MNDEMNPYQSPAAAAAPLSGGPGGPALTDAMLLYLKAASPWLRFMGIIGFIGCGFLVLTGISISIGLGSMAESLGAFGGDIAASFSGGLGILAGSLYQGLGILTFFPAFFTFRFGSKIRKYLLSGSTAELEQAFKNNRSLWMFNGIFTIVSLAAVPVIIIVVIIGAIALNI